MAITYELETPRGVKYDVEFDQDPTPEMLDTALQDIVRSESDTGQSKASSAGYAAVRGAASLVPSAIQGVGALIPGGVGDIIRGEGQSLQADLEDIAPVNPAYEDTKTVKGAGAFGSGLSFLGAALVAPQSAVLAGAALAGAAEGADTADELDLTGWRKGVATVGGAGAAFFSERLFGIGSSKFLKGSGNPWAEGLKAVAQEGLVEEPLEGALKDLSRNAAVIGTDKPMVNPLSPKERFEDAAYGAIGALAFGGAAGYQASRLQGTRLMARVEGELIELDPNITEEQVAAMGLRPDQVMQVRPDPAMEKALAAAPTDGARKTIQEVMLATAATQPVFETSANDLADLDAAQPEDFPETTDPAVVEQAPGGISDLAPSGEGTATGSSAPVVSVSNSEGVQDAVNPEVTQLNTEKPRLSAWKNVPGAGSAETNATGFISGKHSENIANVARERGDIGLLITPLIPSYLKHATKYPFIAVDNGVFSKTTPFNPGKFRQLVRQVAENPEAKAKTLFVVAPDVVGDAQKTLDQFQKWAEEIQARGLPVALAAQDGLENMQDQIPWDSVDVLFIGGSTEWKTGQMPPKQRQKWGTLFAEAGRRGIPIHMGRANTNTRISGVAQEIGASTVDGTLLAFGENANLPKITSTLDNLNKKNLNLAAQPYPEAGRPPSDQDVVEMAHDTNVTTPEDLGAWEAAWPQVVAMRKKLRIAKFQQQAKDPDLEPSDQSFSVSTTPTRGMSPVDVRSRVARFHKMSPTHVEVANRPEMKANGWINKATGKVVLNAPYLRDQQHLDETLYHEYIHRIEYDPDFQKDLTAAMAIFPKADLDRLDTAIAKAQYDINEIPTERQATALARAAVAFRKQPGYRQIIQRIKTWFKQQFGRTLNQRDAEAIAARILAKSMAQARAERGVITQAGTGNVRRSSLPADTEVTLTATTRKGPVELSMDAREAEAMLEKRRSSLQALLDCLDG